ncbi:MAG: undecaprenyl-diphosphate phosphatase [Alphaproteobacteria bacterium]|nr:undecaprenyl-diphosphate phosphatase [Alphaproteobacteria bacterium]
MSLFHIVILSLVQGLTEFLPVSSSGHLILLSKLSSFPDQGLEMDIAVHFGSVIAVMIYFAKDIWRIIKDLFSSRFLPDFQKYGNRLFYLLLIGSIPAAIFGLWLQGQDMTALRSSKIIGWNILLFGILLFFADKYGKTERKIEDMGYKDALLIGLAQCLSLIPGTSRSGITITMSRILKIKRRAAAQFCMLLSIPTITGAAMLVGWKLWQAGTLDIDLITKGVSFSFIASMAAIGIMMGWLKIGTFIPFVIYRIVLGVGLLLYSYGIIG